MKRALALIALVALMACEQPADPVEPLPDNVAQAPDVRDYGTPGGIKGPPQDSPKRKADKKKRTPTLIVYKTREGTSSLTGPLRLEADSTTVTR